MPEIKILKILKFHFVHDEWYHAKVLLKRFHLNGHIIGFFDRQEVRATLHVLIIKPGRDRVKF